MLRQPKIPLKVKENQSGCLDEKDATRKICKGTKPRVSRASKKENLSHGNQAWSPKRALKSPRGLGRELSHPEGHPGSCQCPGGSGGALQGDVGREPTLPRSRKEEFAGSRSESLGNESCSTPQRDKAEGNADFGRSEGQREKPVDFATVTIAEFGISPESFTRGCKGDSPAWLKLRRRSTIGLRGSPENNSLIRYLAQQRSKRQKEAFTQISPFKHANVRSLKDKIETFQTSFESLQEAEGETGLSGLSHVEDSQEGGSCLAQWSEKLMLDNSGADLEENCRENVIRNSKSDPRICSILSPKPGVTEPAAPKEWVFGEKTPPESLETVAIGDTLERGHVYRSEHAPADTTSDVVSDPSRKEVGSGAGLSLGAFEESRALLTPPGTGTFPFGDLAQSGSLRSILKKTPTRQLVHSPKEYLNDAVGRGEGESVPVSNYEKTSEASDTDSTDSLDFRTPKKKKVTFGQVLSPEIFDQTLPANTPLRRGASPGCASPAPRPDLTTQPLPILDFDAADGNSSKKQPPLLSNSEQHLGLESSLKECVEPPQDFLEVSFVAEDPSPVENAEAPTDKADVVKTRSSAKRKRTRQTSSGKRRKRKVKKTLYGERQMASKKPLLSPIPEIPELFSSGSSPDSPKADGFFAVHPKSWNVCKEKAVVEGLRGKSCIPAADVCPSSEHLHVAAPPSSRGGTFQGSQADLEAASGTAQEVSNVVPGEEGGFDTSEDFQQAEAAACENEAEHNSSLRENEQLQGNVEFVEQQATDVPEGARRTQCPQTGSVSASPARRRRRSSSAIYFPPVESLELTGTDLPVASYNVEEVLAVPRGSSQPSRRRGSTGGDTRVRRSMRLSRDAGSQGLAWIELPREIPIPGEPPLPAAAPRSRRRGSTSVRAGSESVELTEQNPGKENEDSAPRAEGSCRRRSRKSAPTTPETP